MSVRRAVTAVIGGVHVGDTKTEDSRRTIPVEAAALAGLGERGADDAWVFTSHLDEGEPVNTQRSQRALRAAMAEAVAAGIVSHAMTQYGFRHSWISHQRRAGGMTDAEIADYAGTSALVINQTYGKREGAIAAAPSIAPTTDELAARRERRTA